MIAIKAVLLLHYACLNYAGHFDGFHRFSFAVTHGTDSENTELSNRLCQQQALSSDSDNLDKPLFFECCGDCAAQTKYTSGRIPKSSDGWPRNPARSTQRITDGVAARSPGKASSYLYAMKGEARRRRLKCLAPYGIRADPHRESYRFHHRNKYLSQYRSCLREKMNITSTLNQVIGNNLGWKLSREISSSVSGVAVDGNFGGIISVIVKTLNPAL